MQKYKKTARIIGLHIFFIILLHFSTASFQWMWKLRRGNHLLSLSTSSWRHTSRCFPTLGTRLLITGGLSEILPGSVAPKNKKKHKFCLVNSKICFNFAIDVSPFGVKHRIYGLIKRDVMSFLVAETWEISRHTRRHSASPRVSVGWHHYIFVSR